MLMPFPTPASVLAVPAAAALPQLDAGARTFGEFLRSGGELMIPLGLCSVLVLGCFLERLIALRRARICPRRLDAPLAALRAGDVAAARAALEGDASPAARIALAGVRRAGFPLGYVEGAMSDQAQKEIERLRHNIRPLALIGGVAPLLGLLGTVLGIAEAFHDVARAGMGKPEVLAGGIEVALTTTIVGLCVAIPAILASSWLQGRVRRLILWTDERLAGIGEALAARPETDDPEAACASRAG